jgi:hypothetical protein
MRCEPSGSRGSGRSRPLRPCRRCSLRLTVPVIIRHAASSGGGTAIRAALRMLHAQINATLGVARLNSTS